jgi:hypothetical protein
MSDLDKKEEKRPTVKYMNHYYKLNLNLIGYPSGEDISSEDAYSLGEKYFANILSLTMAILAIRYSFTLADSITNLPNYFGQVIDMIKKLFLY